VTQSTSRRRPSSARSSVTPEKALDSGTPRRLRHAARSRPHRRGHVNRIRILRRCPPNPSRSRHPEPPTASGRQSSQDSMACPRERRPPPGPGERMVAIGLVSRAPARRRKQSRRFVVRMVRAGEPAVASPVIGFTRSGSELDLDAVFAASATSAT
jgi:hypothetical protein